MKKVMPRTSRVLDKMRRGEKAISFKINSESPRLVEMAAAAGFDAVWICQEHVPTDHSTMEAQILAGKARGADVIVRVAKGSYSDYIRPLEADASGIMVPHLMSAAEARQLVQMVRYQPIGRRPLDGGNADGMYARLSYAEYLPFANANRMVIVQVEDPEVVPELDEICQLDGIDMIFFGPGDYSHALGITGQFKDPEIQRIRKLVVETAHKYGKFAGTVSGTATLGEYFDMGYDYINCGADVTAVGANCQSIMDTFRSCL